MRLSALAFFAGLSVLATSASAQLVTEPRDEDQYHVVEIEDGLVRIDRRTGEITECQDSANGWVCRLSADDRLAYEAEINRLDAEVERLENELVVAREASGGAGQDASPIPSPEDETSQDGVLRDRLDLPTDEELDAVMETAEEVVRRFFGMVEDLREDLEFERAQ